MAVNKPAITVRKASARSRVSNLKKLLSGCDGRLPMARRYRDICAALVSDSGSIEQCPEARLQLIRRFSATCVMAETMEAALINGEEINISEHSLLSSTLTRLASRIGIDRRAKIVGSTLSDYFIESENAEAAS